MFRPPPSDFFAQRQSLYDDPTDPMPKLYTDYVATNKPGEPRVQFVQTDACSRDVIARCTGEPEYASYNQTLKKFKDVESKFPAKKDHRFMLAKVEGDGSYVTLNSVRDYLYRPTSKRTAVSGAHDIRWWIDRRRDDVECFVLKLCDDATECITVFMFRCEAFYAFCQYYVQQEYRVYFAAQPRLKEVDWHSWFKEKSTAIGNAETTDVVIIEDNATETQLAASATTGEVERALGTADQQTTVVYLPEFGNMNVLEITYSSDNYPLHRLPAEDVYEKLVVSRFRTLNEFDRNHMRKLKGKTIVHTPGVGSSLRDLFENFFGLDRKAMHIFMQRHSAEFPDITYLYMQHPNVSYIHMKIHTCYFFHSTL